MSTIVHYQYRDLDHMRAGARQGKGGLVIHHGTIGCCYGPHVDGAHRWVTTGAMPVQFLVETAAAPTEARAAENERASLTPRRA